MLRLLALLAGLALLALIVLMRHEGLQDAPLVSFEADEALAASTNVPETEQRLESIEDTTDLRRAPTPDALPRVFGHVELAGDAALLQGGKVRVLFEDHHHSALDAEAAHARALEEETREPLLQTRVATVRRDGWWYVDLPGKSWLVEITFVPPVRTPEMPPALAATIFGDPALENTRPKPGSKGSRRFVAQRDSIPSKQVIERAIERGKLELALPIETGLCARGLVLDAGTQQPVAGAQIALKSMRGPCLMTTSEADGSFRMPGIDPADLQPQNGSLVFVVQSARHATVLRESAWEPGQEGLVAFRVYLEPKGR